MILTERKIRELVKTNELITPFLEEKLQSESYDVTIGKEVVTMKKRSILSGYIKTGQY